MDEARLANGLGLAALMLAPLAVVGYGWTRPGFGMSPLESVVVAFALPLLLAVAATLLYYRLPKDRRDAAVAAPLSLINLLLLPVVLVGLWMWAMSQMGNV